LAGEIVEVELAQGLGLIEALTIGVGTMIGAGIFVLPGIIITRVGPAAVLSFFFGGVIALFAAMCAAELATGMPKSGGGYYFISRALGPLWGSIIGWGSWFGLIFASAFYMVGFGEYLTTVVHLPVVHLAVGMTVLLLVLNLTGSKVAGQVQNLIVAVLLGVLVLFAGRGLFSVDFSLVTKEPFMPFGFGAVFTGTALLFVTYCGFGEVASMAEEIREPGRNLPRALLGSVILVTVLYCLVIGVCVLLRPVDQLGGSTVVADLAQDMMGRVGRWVMMIGAIMATISSANASIMSASRISFAMGRDKLIFDWLNQVHPRFRVPHRALLVTGGLTIALVLVRRVDLLAEAAGFLHLLLYSLICVACIVLRYARPAAYRPAFRVPLFPWIPLLGAAGTFAVAFFMSPIVLLSGLGLVLFSVLYYYFYAGRRTELRGVWPYFLRRGVIEPALDLVERWGAAEDELPTIMVAVAHPEREEARLRLAADLLGSTRGQVLAVNVFVADVERAMEEEVLEQYYQTIERRHEALRQATDALGTSRARFISHVPLAASPFCGLLSAAQASKASAVIVGWPEPEEEPEASRTLLRLLDRYLRCHLMVFRQQGPIPSDRVAAVVDQGPGADLALLTAARLANRWRVPLLAARTVPPDTPAEVQQQIEEALDALVGELARATAQALPAATLKAAVVAQAAVADLVVVGSERVSRGRLDELLADIGQVRGPSLMVVRATEDKPIDVWM